MIWARNNEGPTKPLNGGAAEAAGTGPFSCFLHTLVYACLLPDEIKLGVFPIEVTAG